MNSLRLTLCLFLLISSSSFAQVYFSENFDDCDFPTEMIFERHDNSKGWLIGTNEFHRSDKFPMADNGTCYAAINDDKYDSEDGTAHEARGDAMITPWLDLSTAEAVAISYDYMTMQGSTLGLYYSYDDVNWVLIQQGPIFSTGGMIDWQPFHVLLFGGLNPKIDPNQPVKFKFEFNDRGLAKFYGAAIDNISVHEVPREDAVIAAHWMSEYVTPGSRPLKLGLHNLGSDYINSVVVAWQLNDGPVHREYIWGFGLDQNRPIGYTGPGNLSIAQTDAKLDLSQWGDNQVKCFIEEVNGKPSLHPINDTFEFTIQVVPHLPVKKVISYKFSHHTCTPCYEVNEKYRNILPMYSEIIPVAIQNGNSDPMTIPEGRRMDALYAGFTHPATLADLRLHSFHNRFKYTSSEFINEKELLQFASPISIDFESVRLTENQNFIEVVLHAEVYAQLEGDFRFNLYVLEDSIQYYQAGAPQGSDYQHMKILRSVAGGINGVQGSIPALNEIGDEVEHRFMIPVQDHWKLKDLRLVGLVQNKTGQPLTHHVMNAESTQLKDWLVNPSHHSSLLPIEIFPNPAYDRLSVTIPQSEGVISYVIYNSAGIKFEQGTSRAVNGKLLLNIDNWPVGIYNLQIEFGSQHGTATFIKK